MGVALAGKKLPSAVSVVVINDGIFLSLGLILLKEKTPIPVSNSYSERSEPTGVKMSGLAVFLSKSGLLHLLTILISATIVSLFSILWTWPLIIQPKYSLKTTQQVINFIVPVIAIILGVLYKDCLG